MVFYYYKSESSRIDDLQCYNGSLGLCISHPSAAYIAIRSSLPTSEEEELTMLCRPSRHSSIR